VIGAPDRQFPPESAAGPPGCALQGMPVCSAAFREAARFRLPDTAGA